MICETIKPHLVAYRDGELSEQDRAHVVAHLRTCPACTREEKQLARVNHLLTNLERIAPSPDFAATFWRRLEQEGHGRQEEPESRLARWWRELREELTGWQWTPALVGAASLFIFLSYIFSNRPTTTSPTQPAAQVAANVPAPVAEEPGLFVNYKVIADLDKLSHFDEIASVQPGGKHNTELASEENLPPDLLKDPSFFVQYPILQKMEQLENLEAVLNLPAEGSEHGHG
ncbi:MAG TPA: zf-HC2 domain-containing protein [Candidatus Binatia bacterium]|jgi:hypothetical protein|nr:zf-HC2 domain-containing protein [Candidatus Binatia bacterium]